MQKIRIGNDLTLRITVTRRGAAEELTGNDLTLLLRTPFSTTKLTPPDISPAPDGTLLALFPGDKQTRTGRYTLTLIEQTAAGARSTADLPAAFALVPATQDETADTGTPLTGAQTLDLDLDLTTPANGLSAYELALLHGYTGAEQDFADTLIAAASASTQLADLDTRLAALEAADLLAK